MKILSALLFSLLFSLLLSLLSHCALAADNEVVLVIRDHRFEPAEVRVPAGQKIKLVVHNQDTTPEEFESHELNREKLIAPGTRANIFVGPLKPGRYTFFGEFHEKTAPGPSLRSKHSCSARPSSSSGRPWKQH